MCNPRGASGTGHKLVGTNLWNPSFCQGQISAEWILHLVNPNLGSNSGMRTFEPRIWGRILGSNFFGPALKNSPSRNALPKNHIKKFTPEFGLKNSHCTSAGPFFAEFLKKGTPTKRQPRQTWRVTTATSRVCFRETTTRWREQVVQVVLSNRLTSLVDPLLF